VPRLFAVDIALPVGGGHGLPAQPTETLALFVPAGAIDHGPLPAHQRAAAGRSAAARAGPGRRGAWLCFRPRGGDQWHGPGSWPVRPGAALNAAGKLRPGRCYLRAAHRRQSKAARAGFKEELRGGGLGFAAIEAIAGRQTALTNPESCAPGPGGWAVCRPDAQRADARCRRLCPDSDAGRTSSPSGAPRAACAGPVVWPRPRTGHARAWPRGKHRSPRGSSTP